MKYSYGFFLLFLFVISKVQGQIYTQWSPYSDCTATCNTPYSIRTRQRTCTPANLCQNALLTDTIPCNTQYPCPDYRLGDWGSWSACSESCRVTQSNPTRVRTRSYCLSNSTSTYQCTSDFMVNYEPCNTVACSIAKSCDKINFTFVFLMDVSYSIDTEQWISEKDFVKSFVNSSALEANQNVDVAVVLFGNDASVALPCHKFTTKNDFMSFMDKLNLRGGATAINKGLLAAREVYKSCPKNNMLPVVILLTDGEENVDDENSSRFLTETQIKSEALLVAGAVDKFNKDEINRITSYDVNGQNVSYSFFADDFTSLLTLFGNKLYPFVLEKSGCETRGNWTTWSSWGGCSQVCGVTGTMQRSRSCINPVTLKVQEDCEPDVDGANYSFKTCFVSCTSFSDWTSWGACSASCRLDSGPPICFRNRTCLPGPGSCIGSLSETQECNTNVPCQGTLTDWGEWDECSAICQIGYISPYQTRSRVCSGNTLNGNCNGKELIQTQNCHEGIPCEGTISEWNSWGACSADCNNLVNIPYQTRTRTCSGYSTWNPLFKGCTGYNTSEQRDCNNITPCQGTWSSFGAWSVCSETCQSNTSVPPSQTQTRQCIGATFGGGCVGFSSNTQPCNEKVSCPGVLTAWTAFGACSATCQYDYNVPQQYSTRNCTGNTFGGNCGRASLIRSKNCLAEVLCPGTLSGWGAWSECSATCNTQVNGPYQFRNQTCSGVSIWRPNVVPCNGESLNEQKLCNQQVSCPGYYPTWSAWGTCSESCQSNVVNYPTQFRTRTCQGFTLNGTCVGVSYETQNCSIKVSCPGDLTQWSEFSLCSQSCQIGSVVPTTNRVRSCLNPTFGGNCLGQPLNDNQPCNAGISCPGQLTDWTSWSQCPATCQQAIGQYNLQYRTRQCMNASYTGNCGGLPLSDQIPCVKDVQCPGILSQWSSYSSCSESCASNPSALPSQTRTRTCTTATLGANCGGVPLIEKLSCNGDVGCPGVWTSWGPYTDCSASCQSNGNAIPTQSRQRFCVNSTLNGTCPSDNFDKTQTVQCSVGVICPVKGTWEAWSTWSLCSVSCGAGMIQRSRLCSTPYPPGAGDDCIGNSTQSLPCKHLDCPLSCALTKPCNCAQVKQWSTVPTFDQFQSRNLNLAAIDNVLGFLKSYGDDTVNKACEACNTMLLTTLRSNVGNQLDQAKAARTNLELIKKDLRAVINCNGVILNNPGLWSLYDLMFERATMLEGVIVELNAIYLRFDAALTSCQSYGWIHQTFKTILRKCI